MLINSTRCATYLSGSPFGFFSRISMILRPLYDVNYKSCGRRCESRFVPFMANSLARTVVFAPACVFGLFLFQPIFQLVGWHVDDFVPFSTTLLVDSCYMDIDETYWMTVSLSLTIFADCISLELWGFKQEESIDTQGAWLDGLLLVTPYFICNCIAANVVLRCWNEWRHDLSPVSISIICVVMSWCSTLRSNIRSSTHILFRDFHWRIVVRCNCGVRLQCLQLGKV